MSWRATGSVVGIVALSSLAGACRPKPSGEAPPAPSASASLTVAGAGVASADAAPSKAPLAFTVVAQAAEPMTRFVRLPDGRILLLTGPLVYEAKPDGSLTLVAPLEAFGAVLPDDESLVGYVDGAPSVRWATSDKEGLVAQWGMKTFRLTGGKLVAATGAVLDTPVVWRDRIVGERESTIAWLSGDGPLPKISALRLAIDPNGALTSIGGSGSVHVDRPGADPVEVPIPGKKDGECSFASSDGGLYVRCRIYDKPPPHGHVLQKVRSFRWEAGAWKETFEKAGRGPASVAADGALWVAEGREIQRCDATTCTPAPGGEMKAIADAPGFRESAEDVMVNDAFKTRRTFYLSNPKPSAPSTVTQIVARGTADVWALVPAGSRVLVVHNGAPAGQKEPMRLPLGADARVLVRNTKPPTPWVGHCDQIFIRTGPVGDADALAKRDAEVRGILDKLRTDEDYANLAYALVTGRLHETASSGILLWRTEVESSQAYLERVATKLVDAFAKNPVDRPTAYCTVPVLERVLASSATYD